MKEWMEEENELRLIYSLRSRCLYISFSIKNMILIVARNLFGSGIIHNLQFAQVFSRFFLLLLRRRRRLRRFSQSHGMAQEHIVQWKRKGAGEVVTVVRGGGGTDSRHHQSKSIAMRLPMAAIK